LKKSVESALYRGVTFPAEVKRSEIGFFAACYVEMIRVSKIYCPRESGKERAKETNLGFQSFDVFEGSSSLDESRHRIGSVRNDVFGSPRSVIA